MRRKRASDNRRSVRKYFAASEGRKTRDRQKKDTREESKRQINPNKTKEQWFSILVKVPESEYVFYFESGTSKTWCLE